MTCVERHVSHELHRELPHGVTHCTNRLMNATVSAACPITGRNPHVFDRRLEELYASRHVGNPRTGRLVSEVLTTKYHAGG